MLLGNFITIEKYDLLVTIERNGNVVPLSIFDIRSYIYLECIVSGSPRVDQLGVVQNQSVRRLRRAWRPPTDQPTTSSCRGNHHDERVGAACW